MGITPGSTMEVAMTVKEICDTLGLSTQEFFQNAYQRHGLKYSIGPPEVTHPRYEKTGFVPHYVAMYRREMENLILRHHRSVQ